MSKNSRNRRARNFLNFVRYFFRYVAYIQDIIFGLIVLMATGTLAIAHFEKMRLGDALYFACITGLSVGYGDIVPATAMGRIVSVAIGMIGMIFMGLVVAIATKALMDATAENQRPSTMSDERE